MALKLSDLGERRAIDEIRKAYAYEWPDDDCLYFPSGGKYVLVKTDAMPVESHIPSGVRPDRAGYFFAAANISDIAAMGGIPRYFMSSIILPRGTGLGYLKAFERGIARCLKRYKVKMAGGDLKEGRPAFIGVAVGEVERERILRRRGARNGDLLCVTGRLGKNAAGYYMWKRYGGRRWAELLIEVEPRIASGRLISSIGATAAIDLSDGVYSAVSQLGRINGCGFEIDYSKLPVDRRALLANEKLSVPIEELALNFGGEYELLFTISESAYRKAERTIKREESGITVIGRVTSGRNVLIREGRRIPIKKRGYEHFLRGDGP